MLFSIIVPVYNVELYLEECLQSILCQIENNNQFEILLIDDGSTDKSGKICDEYSKKYPDIIKVFHNENQGLLLTRRFGFNRAIGEYIINCDSDDVLEVGMIARLIDTINKYNKPDMILFNFNSYDGIKKHCQFSNLFSTLPDSLVTKKIVLKRFLSDYSVVSMWCKVYKRELIDNDKSYLNFGKLSTGEDSIQTLELFSNAESFVYLNCALYNYRIGSGMTGKFDLNYYDSFKEFLLMVKNNNIFNTLDNFDYLFLIKFFQIFGRAVTQSRYKNWDNIGNQIDYLRRLYYDDLFVENRDLLIRAKKDIQSSHYIMLNLLRKKHFITICILLKIKNFTRYIRGKK